MKMELLGFPISFMVLILLPIFLPLNERVSLFIASEEIKSSILYFTPDKDQSSDFSPA